MEVSSFVGYRLCKKLRAPRKVLRGGIKKFFCQVDDLREALIKVVEDLDKASENRKLRLEEVVARQNAEKKI